MIKPTLLVMAAGMGSRYGGLKQIDPVSAQGEIIMDFSLYDAMMAGFERAVFVIRKENEEDFHRLIDDRAGKFLRTEFVYQDMDDLPEGFSVPEGREKPWGTCHAVLSARNVIEGPFAVINADDYYGPETFQVLYEFLEHACEEQEQQEKAAGGDASVSEKQKYHYAMVGFQLSKTLTENGSVARGICELDKNGFLQRVTERTKIRRVNGVPAYTEDDGKTWTNLPEDAVVSMNTWAFTKDMMAEGWKRMPAFLEQAMKENPLKGEYFLPQVVQEQIDEGLADVKVLHTQDRWYGVTYKEDKKSVVTALQSKKDHGLYPEILWHTADQDQVIWR
ncbi:MAG: sugar phosphate nucleotidyltransferase [Eubacteriales bacterium]|nr:sugar phosphate nucleotidyltransferase [Eubacteriales bacterium]